MPLLVLRLLVLAALVQTLAAAPAAAHESVDEALAHVDAALSANPRDSELWRRRADLQRSRGDLEAAKAALTQACALGLAPALAERERGLLARAEGRLSVAESHLQRARELAPADVETLAAHAETLAELGRSRAAAETWARVIELAPRAGPEIHLARVRALAASADASEALRALAVAEASLGPVPALEQEGLALELRAGRIDAALARLERASAPARRRESWRVQRAEILESAGRSQEAAAEYAAVLASLGTLPSTRRESPAAQQLAARARDGIERLAGSSGVRAQ
jgi:tetratricopeptide (TPR) repeat protein